MKQRKGTKILATLLAVSLLACCSVWADNAPMLIATMDTATTEPLPMPSYTASAGIISEKTDEYIVLGETMEEQKQFNLSANTVIIKADGTPASLEDCQENVQVTVYHAMATTMSIPPQSAAKVVVLMDEETTMLPLYGEVASVTEGEKALEILTADGSYMFYGTEETEVVPYKTRNIVTLADIQEGSRILAWAEVMTMSLPAQVAPVKIMLLPDAEEASTPVAGITIDGEILENAVIESVGEIVMLPLRAVSEKLGYIVTWNGETRSIDLSKEGESTVITLGDNKVGMARANILEQPPVLIGDLTYVPATFFNTLLDADNAVSVIGTASVVITR